LLMEFLKNGSVEDYLYTNPGTSQDIRIRWCKQMASALAYLHNRKPNFLIDRDVKPTNFLVTAALNCKLADFGVSRLFDSNVYPIQPQTTPPMTTPMAKGPRCSRFGPRSPIPGRTPRREISVSVDQTGNVGTLRYMAPEVRKVTLSPAQGAVGSDARASYGVKADVFSVGMVMYFVFENTPPSLDGARNPDEHFAALAKGTRPAYSRTRKVLRRIIDLCLRQSIDSRLSSRGLSTLLTGLPSQRTWLCCSRPDPRHENAVEAADKIYARFEEPSCPPPIFMSTLDP